jgi:20S proteasome subunit beta 2
MKNDGCLWAVAALSKRNSALEQAIGVHPPSATSTGTTIAGLVCRDGVVLGADTRSSNGDVVADKHCEKIHYLADNMRCCGAGTAADTSKVTELMSSRLALHSYRSDRQPRVSTAVTMLKSHLFGYQGYIGAFLVLGGFDSVNGPQLYSIMAGGSSDCVPFTTLGSGSLAAMSVLEAEYREDMPKDDAIDLLARSVRYGVFNDNGSGSSVDIAFINAKGTEYKRKFQTFAERPYSCKRGYNFSPGTTELYRLPKRTPVFVGNRSVFNWRDFVSVEEGDTLMQGELGA